MAFRRLERGLAAAILIVSYPVGGSAQEPDTTEEPELKWEQGPPADPDPEPQPPPDPQPAPAPTAAPPPPPAAPIPPHYPPYGYPGHWQPREDPLRTDPLLPVGITFLSIGALSAVVGALVYAGAGEGDTLCSSLGSGCVERPDHSRAIAGGGFIGGGAGMAVVAIPALIQGAGKKPREGYRRSHGMVAAGSVFAHLGGGIFGAGAGSMIVDSTHGLLDATGAEAALMGVGGALVVLGAVLWGVGAERIDGNEVAREGAR